MTHLKETTNKIDYLEKKPRQNNIRIYNLKEGAQAEVRTHLLENLLKETLDSQVKQKIMQAHEQPSALRTRCVCYYPPVARKCRFCRPING